MEIGKSQVFNLWDTNGRRHDVINAIEIYLHLLRELYNQYPNENWDAYPNSTLQYRFYKAAIESSPDVFQGHSSFDNFEQYISDKYDAFAAKTLPLNSQLRNELDTNIEQRARHYTSNLVRLGFADKDRNISSTGKDLLNGSIQRDKLEELLPITDTNLILFRQLLKLRIYTRPDAGGSRFFYSPCLMALYLLLNNDSVDINYFKHQIQGISPYWQEQINLTERNNVDLVNLIIGDTMIPQLFALNAKISKSDFTVHIRNRKSTATIPIYYAFYTALYDYVQNPTEENYVTLREILLGDNKTKIEKAFGCGSEVLKCGSNARPYTHNKFIEENKGNALLTNRINSELYKQYSVSKYLDTAREYSDTTIRMLGATGLFQFSKPLVELSHKELFRVIFTHYDLKQAILGTVTKQEHEQQDTNFYEEKSLVDILEFNSQEVNSILEDLHLSYGVATDIRSALVEENRQKLELHIQEKYPQDKILELLKMFSNRQNDRRIKQYVNEDATVPTIYEFIIAIAWYYISNRKISVYDSLNLTLNGDFEPVIHAGGGAGDIVVKYTDKIVMLEATLMNAAAQKRGEWEPVLRHAINLTAESYPQRVFTLFVADTLDYNTINIWRAVAAVTLESSTTGEKTEHVIIMPFTNEHLCHFIENSISDERIIAAIDNSYDEIKANFDDTWHEKILATL